MAIFQKVEWIYFEIEVVICEKKEFNVKINLDQVFDYFEVNSKDELYMEVLDEVSQ